MAEQGRATKQLGRLHAHVLTLRSFAREIPKPLKKDLSYLTVQEPIG